MHRASPAFLSLILALVPAPAAASGPPRPPAPSVVTARVTEAEALFEQGRKLVGLGRYVEACASFAESERLDHGVGTLLNLADCYEKNGQLATAWAGFRTAAAAAAAEGQPDREHIARERELALQPQLAHLAILVPTPLPPGAEVHRDGILVSPWLWGSPVPVDPGDHAVLVAAPGKIDHATMVHVPKQPAMTFVARIPVLQARPAPTPKAAAPAVIAPPPARHPRATAGIVLIGVSGAAVIVGSIFGVKALGLKGDSAAHCHAGDLCDGEGFTMREDAVRAGTASSIAFIAAGATLVSGLILYATAPERRGFTASVGLSGTTAGVSMGATW
jgi:serine/threonine-protein kinase